VSSLNPLHSLLIITVLVIGAGAAGAASRRFGQPRVIGVIAWGIAIGSLQAVGDGSGPLLLSNSTKSLVHVLAQLGLVLFMFSVGQELRSAPSRGHSHDQSAEHPDGLATRIAPCVLLANLLVPLVPGLLVAWPLAQQLGSGQIPEWSTVVFIGLTLSVTAVPVLAVILDERDLTGTRVGRLSLILSVWNDGIIWACVTVLVAVTGSESLPRPAVTSIALVALTAVITVPRMVTRRLRRVRTTSGSTDSHGTSDSGAPPLLLLLLPLLVAAAVVGAAATDALGIHPAVGALVAGLAVPRSAMVDAAFSPIRLFTEAMLLPLFFVDLAIGAPIQALHELQGWALAGAALLITAALAGKLAAGHVIARVAALPRRDGRTLGALLTCRGVTELAVAAVGAQAGLIGRPGFAVLMLVALIATAVTAPLLRLAEWRTAREAGASLYSCPGAAEQPAVSKPSDRPLVSPPVAEPVPFRPASYEFGRGD